LWAIDEQILPNRVRKGLPTILQRGADGVAVHLGVSGPDEDPANRPFLEADSDPLAFTSNQP